MGNTNSLLNSLKVVLAARNLSGFEDAYLQYEIEQAIAEINRCRRFTATAKKPYDTKYEYPPTYTGNKSS